MSQFVGLPEQLLPLNGRQLLLFYELIDRIYCFLTKQRISCSITNIANLYRQLVPLSDLADKPHWHCFHPDDLQYLCDLCGSEMILCHPGGEDVQEKVLQFYELKGIGKQTILKRRKLVLNAIWECIHRHFVTFSQSKEESLSAAVLKEIKERGWTVGYDPEGALTLPARQTSTLTASVPCDQPSINMDLPLLDDSSATESSTVDVKLVKSDGFKANSAGELSHIIEELRRSALYKGQIQNVMFYPKRDAIYEELSKPLPQELQERITATTGIKRFYRHQAMAINAIRNGQHAIISTSTASGKSLIFNIPVLEALQSDPTATALYLFPTKVSPHFHYFN